MKVQLGNLHAYAATWHMRKALRTQHHPRIHKFTSKNMYAPEYSTILTIYSCLCHPSYNHVASGL